MARRTPAELAALRAEIEKREVAARRKLARLRSKGIDVGELDPRRETKNRLTTAQAKSYLKQLNEFVSRRNQYVPGYRGKPIPRRQWEEYKREEKRVNDFAQSLLYPHAGKKLSTGQTFGDKVAMGDVGHSVMGSANNNIFQRVEKASKQFSSPEALSKAIKALRAKGNDKWKRRQIREGRKQMQQLLDLVGNSEMAKTIADLTDDQFMLAFNTPGWANKLSIMYEISQMRLTDKNRASSYENVFNTQNADVMAHVDWVKKNVK